MTLDGQLEWACELATRYSDSASYTRISLAIDKLK